MDLVELFINKGADVNVINSLGLAPLHRACDLGLCEIARLLLDAGANAEITDAYGWMPLHYSARNGSADVIKLLLNNAPHLVNVKASDGSTPLHIAAHYYQIEAVKELLHSGADFDLTSACGWTPLSIAAAEGNSEVVTILIRAGAKVDVQDDKGFTPLQNAKQRGKLSVVEVLNNALTVASVSEPLEPISLTDNSISHTPKLDIFLEETNGDSKDSIKKQISDANAEELQFKTDLETARSSQKNFWIKKRISQSVCRLS